MTEKNYNPEQKQMKAMKKQEKAEKKTVTKEVKKEIIKDIEKDGVSEDVAKKEEKIAEEVEEKSDKELEKKSAKAEESKKPEKAKPEKPKKTEAFVNIKDLPISTLHSIAICKFIKGKKIEIAIKDLEDVAKFKKSVPMKGEIPHRKGKIMSGRFPKKASEHFIKVLKSLQANSNVNGLNEPIIVEAIANIAHRPYGRFGRIRRKRTHVKIKAKEMKTKEKKK